MKNSDYVPDYIKMIKNLDHLPLEQKINIFRKLSPEARQDFLENLSEPNELVRQISEEEIYFTIKVLGVDEADALLSLTTSRQLMYILDIEVWNKDEINPDASMYWLNKIINIGEKKILQFLKTSDPELIIIMLSKLITVVAACPDVDLTEQLDFLPSFTLDNTFFIGFRDKDHEEAIKFLISNIFYWNDRFYFNLMEHLSTSWLTEIENMACKWRNGRLADKGFPDYQESLEIYQYLSPASISLNSIACQNVDDRVIKTSGSFVDYPLKLVFEQCFFRDCLSLILDPWLLAKIAKELANLANKIMIADSNDPGILENMVFSLEKVSGYINIALENICAGDPEKAILVLYNNHMESLFRAGYSSIIDLQREAQKFIKCCNGGIENLGNPLSGLLKGLLSKRPFFAENILNDKKARNFRSLDDISLVRSLLRSNLVESQWESI